MHQQKVYLAKIGKVKLVWSRELPSEPSSVTVIKDSAGRYFLSFVVEIEPEPVPVTDKSCGIDLGIMDFATFDNGEKVKAPKPLQRNLARLRRKQKQLSRTEKGSKGRERMRQRVAKLHAKIKDIRTDFLHYLSTKVIRENQSIALEDLNVSGMVKNRKLSRAISDVGWREFRTMLENKAEKYGRQLQIISRWEPTSQTCSSCGKRGGKKDLSVRQWTCLWCGAEHDRDVNAAKNIKRVAGGQCETENAQGGRHQTTVKGAAADEVRTSSRNVQLALF